MQSQKDKVFQIFIAYSIVFVLTYFGVGIFRRWSLRRKIFDLPNERSSHTQPTPRGGGIIICLICLFSLFFYCFLTGAKIPWGYFAGALIVSFVSWFDDLKTIPAFWRFLCHGLAAGIAVWTLGGFELFYVPFYGTVQTNFFGNIVTFLWICWFINAYNFMDGIDGIAATQAVTAGIGWLLIGFSQGFSEIGFYGGILSIAALAFLFHNWQPAKIFMGDVGSAFLGYTFAVMPLFAGRRPGEADKTALFPIFAILFVWFFVFDSVLTFLRRLFRGEKVWRAHREHIYQQLVIAGFSHQVVTIFYGTLSVLLIFVLLILVKYQISFEKIFLFVLAETVLLLVVWHKRKVFI